MRVKGLLGSSFSLSRRCGHCDARRAYSSPSTVKLGEPSSLIRPIGQPNPAGLEDDFAMYSSFYSPEETRDLLKGALWKLDRVDSTRKRRRRAAPNELAQKEKSDRLQDLFEGGYGFQEGHYDSVIHDYRETTISSLPPKSSFPTIPSLLDRSFRLLPGSPSITGDVLPSSTISHLLHLAPTGKILGHVDNLEASGSVIMGICLGADRILRLGKKIGDDTVGWDVLLRNGTVYLQKDKLRYEYQHAILGYEDSEWDGEKLESGHRLSIMVRDAPTRPP